MNYLNTSTNKEKFQELLNSKVMVDKSLLIEKVNEFIATSGKYINMTRPRRFGKSVNANMLACYYNCKIDSKDLFDDLNIATSSSYLEHLNKHNVIYVDFTGVLKNTKNYNEFINKFNIRMKRDILQQYPNIQLYDDLDIDEIIEATNDKFIFIFDEWDWIFHSTFFSDLDKQSYLLFLKGLLKDKAYVELCYMTGVLPIAKYSSGSELNMFKQYSFLEDRRFSTFFGFTENEVKELCLKHGMDFNEVSDWYNGYYDTLGNRLYNPRSVSDALGGHYCTSYWTETGPFNEVSDLISNNTEDIRDDIVNMISGNPIEIYFDEQFSAERLTLNTRDEILSAMVIYGFLSYHDGYLSIPNKELMIKFKQALMKVEMGFITKLAKQSRELLIQTIEGNSEYVAKIIEEVHHAEAPVLSYNNENTLANIINIAYLGARDKYRVERESKSGKGYADFIFYPNRKSEPALIIELKVDETSTKAIEQIRERNYLQKVKEYDVVMVGINYDKKTKEHSVEIERVDK